MTTVDGHLLLLGSQIVFNQKLKAAFTNQQWSWSCKLTHDLNWSHEQSYKLDGTNSLYDTITYDPVNMKLSESEADAKESRNHAGWNQAF